MKKQAMIASLMALALLVSPIGSLGSMHQVSAEEDPGAVAYSVSGNASRAGETAEKVQLDTPTNLRWGYDDGYYNVKYNMYWEGVNHSFYPDYYGVMRTDWEIEVYKDDQPYKEVNTTDWGGYVTRRPDYYYNGEMKYFPDNEFITDYTIRTQHVSSALSYEKLNESGTYKFRIRALAQFDDETYQDSEWSEWSETITYVRPEQELDTIVGYWDAQEAGVFHFKTLENKEYLYGYKVLLYKQCEDGTWETIVSGLFGWNSDGEEIDADYSDYISEYGEGKYCFVVQALSRDVDVVANGRPGPKSDILDTTVNAEKLSGILDSATDKSAAETVELLTDSADISAIQQAMQTSDTFREQIRELEDRYVTEQGITVKAPEVSDTAKEYVDSNKVSVVGAAFNAAQGSEVSLQMDVTPQENRIPAFSRYQKDVQLDIKLVSAGRELHDLAMPISVTMPIPQGLDASQLVILHYHADGTTEKAAFHVNDDGTITFTVTSFSTFVFAEESPADTPDDNPDPTPGQNRPPYNPIWDPIQDAGGSSDWSASLGNLENQIASAAPGATVKVTREQNINTLPNSIMQVLAKRGDVTLEMEYTYEGTDYHVIIPAGKAVDNDIPWYGPLYLSAYFSAGSAVAGNSVSAYTVQRGDTLGKIARTYHTTVARLAAANPQIKNVDRITPGQVININ